MRNLYLLKQGDCQDLLNNGLEFLEASRRCTGSDENGTIHVFGGDEPKMLHVSTVVNAAFACEMFLKALLLMEGKQYPTDRDGHHLKKLFDKLSSETKNKINKFFGYSKITKQAKFEQFITLHPNDFTEVRYLATNTGWQGLSPVEVYTHAFNLGQITKNLLEDKS